MAKTLMQGDEAIAEGALKAGMSFFAAYPITPASEIMHHLAKVQSLNFVHAEDEIASINMIIGASMAGAKAMTSSSGPGISLKQEGIGYAHMTETPVVIVNIQRVGPATGMPTMPNQADLMQCKYGPHGDVFPIVFYPNSVEECYKYTIEAFNAAEESLSPVFLLCDGFIGQLYEAVDLSAIEVKTKERSKISLGKGIGHITGLLSENGIPKTKHPSYYKKWIKRIKEKIDDAAKNYAFYEYIPNKKSDTLLIAYGITSRVVLPLKDRYSIFRPIRIFPLLENELKEISKKYKKIVVIEMNEGQYKNEVERILKREIRFINSTGGEVKLSYIEGELKKIK